MCVDLGILADALAIMFGGLFGSRLQKQNSGDYRTLGIGIMIVSLVGFLENMYHVKGENIVSDHLIIVLLSYLLGSRIGDTLHLDERLSNVACSKSIALNAFLDSAMFFGVGGMQICGPIALAVNGDSSQLLIKSAVDLPFAIAFGAAYGKVTALSALPVALIQILIAAAAYFAASLFDAKTVAELCAIGYIVLFFSGFNLVSQGRYKVSNINMLPGILLVLVVNLALDALEVVL